MTLSHEIFPKTFLIFFWELTSKVKYKNFVDIKFWVQVVVFLTLPCDLWNDVPTIYLVSGAVFSWDMLLSPFRARMNFETKQLRVKTLLENLFNSTYSKIVLSKSMLLKQKVSKSFFFFWGSASSISREGLQPSHSHTAYFHNGMVTGRWEGVFISFSLKYNFENVKRRKEA